MSLSDKIQELEATEAVYIGDVKEAVQELKKDLHKHSTLWLEDRINEIFGEKLT